MMIGQRKMQLLWQEALSAACTVCLWVIYTAAINQIKPLVLEVMLMFVVQTKYKLNIFINWFLGAG